MKWYTVKDLASFLGVSQRRARTMITNGYTDLKYRKQCLYSVLVNDKYFVSEESARKCKENRLANKWL